MHKLGKQPNETIVGVSIDFASRLAATETLSTGTITPSLISGVEGTGNELTISNAGVLGTLLAGTLHGGYDGCVYKLTYFATGTFGNQPESEIKVTVKEL
jgi:hypothetical protein